MKDCGLSVFFVGLLFLACSTGVSQAQTYAVSQEVDQTQGTALKFLKSPPAAYPDEAVRKQIEGKVVIKIVVDSSGKVSEARALSGPPELLQAALDSVKQWQFEPPARAPVETTAEISFGFSTECPAAASDRGGVETNGRLLDKDGKVVGTMDYDHDELPRYFDEDRKAGIAGEMDLSLTLDDQGEVKEVHVLKSLSPHLDTAALETVCKWTFNPTNATSDAAHQDLQLKLRYEASCDPHF
jgi:TonB family protein